MGRRIGVALLLAALAGYALLFYASTGGLRAATRFADLSARLGYREADHLQISNTCLDAARAAAGCATALVYFSDLGREELRAAAAAQGFREVAPRAVGPAELDALGLRPGLAAISFSGPSATAYQFERDAGDGATYALTLIPSGERVQIVQQRGGRARGIVRLVMARR